MSQAFDDPFALSRFVSAQEGTYARALKELERGQKQSHWMWYVLPQLRGLGSSPMAVHYGIGSRQEAAAYLAHPLLGQRLEAAVAAIQGHPERSAQQILGSVDALKFRSCLTLFVAVAPSDSIFHAALAHFYGGEPDRITLDLLARQDALDLED